MNVKNELSEAETESLFKENPMPDQDKKNPIAGYAKNGGIAAVILAAVIGWGRDLIREENKDFEVWKCKIEKQLDVLDKSNDQLRIEVEKSKVEMAHFNQIFLEMKEDIRDIKNHITKDNR